MAREAPSLFQSEHPMTSSARFSVVLPLLFGLGACASSATVRTEMPQETAARVLDMADADALFARKAWEEAAHAYAQLAKNDPKLARAWMRLGHCRHMQSDYPAAIAAYEQVQSGPGLTTAKYNIACALARQGKSDEALKALEVALTAGFSDLATLKGDSDFESLRGSPRFEALVAKLASAAPAAYQPPAQARQFDFWIGEWNVETPGGAHAGDSRIEKILNGCALMEHWTSAKGNSGKSFNNYDARKDEWRQHWIDDSGTETFYVGHFADKRLTFTSEEIARDGSKKLHKMSFFDLGAEGVRQWGEVSVDGGNSWATEFDLFYRRK